MYAPYAWSIGDVITSARLNNLETQFQETMEESFVTLSIVSGVITLNLDAAKNFAVQVTAAITSIVVSNIRATSGYKDSFRLKWKGDGTARAVTLPAAFKFESAATPSPVYTSTNNKEDIWDGETWDNGTRMLIFLSGKNY